DIAQRIGTVPASAWAVRALGKLGLKLTPSRMIDLGLRLGPKGDLFGLRRGGLNLAKLRRHPHGVILDEHHPVGVLKKKVFHKDKRVHLDRQEIAEEIAALRSENGHGPDFPLRLIGLRELRSHNSWMHNVEKLMQGDRRHAVRVHPDDAAAVGVDDGDLCRVRSASGAIELAVKITDEVSRGTIAVPHGWGHRGEWRRAADAGGANVNLLASSAPEDLERLAGMAHLNGIPVRLEALAPMSSTTEARHSAEA